jgi:cytosine/adenosine deaminase-related metal-dependent hydrolase
VTTHVAESAQEFEMFAHGRGEMHQWLSRNRREMSDCGLGSPVRHMERCGALDENLLAVHVNYLGPGDAPMLAKRNVNVAHCPRSHAYFRHQPFPIGELSAEGINICLGTDSLASVTKPRKGALELSLLEEMREFSSKTRGLPPETVLRLVTINGARALGLEGKIGELSSGAFADMIAVPHAGRLADAAESVVQQCGHVDVSLIDGQWAIAPAEVNA